MSPFSIDLTDVEAWEASDILPSGTHKVEVIKAEEGSSSNGNPQLELELRAYDGEYQDGTIRDWIVVTPKTAGKVKQILGAFGADKLDGQVKFGPEDVMGKKAQIIVRTEPYNGQERSRVKAYEVVSATTTAAPVSDEEPLPF
jgi:Protein of unknown function (DUF669)